MRDRRLLIVDDSAVIRRALTAALKRQPGLEVAGSASGGLIALMKIPLLCPDVVVLDTEMPELDGLATLAAIRRSYPRLPVIMLNVLTPQGAAATVDALTHGADDYVMKPDDAVPSDAALQIVSDQLALKIALCCPAVTDDHPSRAPVGSASPGTACRPELTRAIGRVDVVAIGISTGGPIALMDLIPRFPAGFPVPILVVQHMPPLFTKLMAERLAAKARISVAEAGPSITLSPGQAWIAPGDFHMAVERAGESIRLVTHRNPPENSCRPAVDVLFRSVAQTYGPHALAVVMTGMGRDGFRGCEEIQRAGGQVIVQDEPSSVVWGMPGLVARAGIAEQVLPLGELGTEIIERVFRHRQMLSAPV